MFNWLTNLFLVKEIKSKEGLVHFKRWRFFSCPWLRIYLHKISRSDEDKHLHTHPWNFISFILWGGYGQKYWKAKVHVPGHYPAVWQDFGLFSLIKMSRFDGHKLTLKEPTWTLVFAYGKYDEWGYLTEKGYIDHETYRRMKNNGEL